MRKGQTLLNTNCIMCIFKFNVLQSLCVYNVIYLLCENIFSSFLRFLLFIWKSQKSWFLIKVYQSFIGQGTNKVTKVTLSELATCYDGRRRVGWSDRYYDHTCSLSVHSSYTVQPEGWLTEFDTYIIKV